MKRAIFIGYDPRLDMQYRVCRASILAHSDDIAVYPLHADVLRRAGLLRRWITKDRDGRMFDTIDGRPVSTEFTYSRFCVPLLAELLDFDAALFCDSDFMFRSDVAELFSHGCGDFPLWCVHHNYTPSEHRKMDGQEQAVYPRKNWSSLMLFNVGHSGLRRLTHWAIATMEGRDLHAMKWLDGEPGPLPETWNWLEGWSDLPDPKAVHFTRGTPDLAGHETAAYADEWRAYARAFGRVAP